jgi:hypothetical protein
MVVPLVSVTTPSKDRLKVPIIMIFKEWLVYAGLLTGLSKLAVGVLQWRFDVLL